MATLEKKREEFRKYLECAGVIDSLSKALIKLYEESEKPENAIRFLQEQMCDSSPTVADYNELEENYEAAKAKISQLERELRNIKSQIRRSASEINLELVNGFDSLKSYEGKPSLLQQHLTLDIFDKLKEAKTEFKSTLLDCIQSGLKNHDSYVGLYAPDFQAYTVFAELFDPIIEAYHGFKRDDVHPETDWGDENAFENLDPDNQFIRSIRIRCARSIEGYAFNPCMKEADYENIMKTLKSATEHFTGELKGNFYLLSEMNENVKAELIKNHFLFKEDDKFLQDAAAYRFWPVGRGIFHNENKTFLIWCCEEDHISVISMENGGDLKQAYSRLKEGLNLIGKYITFIKHERLGYLTFCPTNLGTGIRASVYMNLPKLSADKTKFDEVIATLNLQVRDTPGVAESGEKYYDISNKRRLGLTEFEAIKEMYDGIKQLINMEIEMQN